MTSTWFSLQRLQSCPPLAPRQVQGSICLTQSPDVFSPSPSALNAQAAAQIFNLVTQHHYDSGIMQLVRRGVLTSEQGQQLTELAHGSSYASTVTGMGVSLEHVAQVAVAA